MNGLTDQLRTDFEAMILDVEQLDRTLVDGSYDVPVPDATAEPTQEDVDAASATVVALETRQNELRAALAQLRERHTLMTYFHGRYDADPTMADTNAERYVADLDLLARFDDARIELSGYIDELAAAEQLTTQMLDHWRSALAVLEHDIKWQAYVAEQFGVTDNPRRSAGVTAAAA